MNFPVNRGRGPHVFSDLEPGTEVRGNPLDNPSVDLSRAFDLLFSSSSQSFAGEAVTEQSALGVPAVLAAVNVISGSIASLPLHLKRDDGTSRVIADNDPLYRIVSAVVNDDFETSQSWRRKMVLRLLLGGRAFSFIERNRAGRVTNLWYLDPSRMKVEQKAGRKVYRYQPATGAEITYQPAEIIDLVWLPAEDGLSHYCPLDIARNTIGAAIAALRFSSILFENGGVPPLALTGPALTPGAASRASSDIQESLKRARDEKRNVLVTPNGYDLKPIGFEPQKLVLTDLQRFLVEEICRVWNLPPTFVQDLSNGTFANTEQADIFYGKHTLGPLLALIEGELNAKLFGKANRANVVEFDLGGIERGDYTSVTTGVGNMVNRGVMTVNEGRAKLGLPPIDGGDVPIIQGAMKPLDQAGAGFEPVVPAADPESAQPQDPAA
jgi:HK97 family phage portal protein